MPFVAKLQIGLRPEFAYFLVIFTTLRPFLCPQSSIQNLSDVIKNSC